MLALSLFSCRRGLKEAPHELLYWSANNSFEQTVAREVVAEWNALHPDMQVHQQPIPEGQSSEEVILAAIAGRTTPDIYSNAWPGDVEFYVRAKALVALDQFADFDSVIASRCSAVIAAEARSRDGHVYQIPWKTNPIMMMYNVKLLHSAGFDRPPATYEEYLAAGEALRRRLNCWVGIRDIRMLWWQRFFDFYALYLAASGGRTLVAGDSVLFENDLAVGVMSFLQAMYRNDYFPKQKTASMADLVLLGKVATQFTGPWEISHAEKFKPDDFESDFAPLPVPGGHQGPVYTYGDLKNIIIFSTCRRQAAAWEFVKFMISHKNDLRLLTIASQLPLRRGLLNEPAFAAYFEENSRMAAFARQAEFVRGVDASPVMKEVFDAISQEYETSVIYAEKSPAQAIRDAAKRVRLILE